MYTSICHLSVYLSSIIYIYIYNFISLSSSLNLSGQPVLVLDLLLFHFSILSCMWIHKLPQPLCKYTCIYIHMHNQTGFFSYGINSRTTWFWKPSAQFLIQCIICSAFVAVDESRTLHMLSKLFTLGLYTQLFACLISFIWLSAYLSLSVNLLHYIDPILFNYYVIDLILCLNQIGMSIFC
jgi:hypothetical protein